MQLSQKARPPESVCEASNKPTVSASEILTKQCFINTYEGVNHSFQDSATEKRRDGGGDIQVQCSVGERLPLVKPLPCGNSQELENNNTNH